MIQPECKWHLWHWGLIFNKQKWWWWIALWCEGKVLSTCTNTLLFLFCYNPAFIPHPLGLWLCGGVPRWVPAENTDNSGGIWVSPIIETALQAISSITIVKQLVCLEWWEYTRGGGTQRFQGSVVSLFLQGTYAYNLQMHQQIFKSQVAKGFFNRVANLQVVSGDLCLLQVTVSLQATKTN